MTFEFIVVIVLVFAIVMLVLNMIHDIAQRFSIAAWLFIAIMAFVTFVKIPQTGTAIDRLPTDGKYLIYSPQDNGYFVIREVKPTVNKIKPTLVRIDPKLVEFKKTNGLPLLVVEPRAKNAAWAGKKVTAYLKD